ncbi:hypothetical protein BKN38_01220 [Helicobacter sp. CLO-3]|uniref:O-antigen ligase family protein n=1 Tax=unclassified Helicobacter TaxID=2593540 RepID=UPI000805E4ED|nr:MULTISPECIES: O-antigen ligase family protein [unclassified Helicobacter]OBV29735.1 hypothetical protein BA723_00025 [Helicobacter sp. CLO-3]OHU85188.1 hypothetical protein BKN38_01220 [Helicobacter sp. CLO-3]
MRKALGGDKDSPNTMHKIRSIGYSIAGALFLVGLALLNTGEPTIKPNPLFKIAINALYVALIIFALCQTYIFIKQKQPLKMKIHSFLISTKNKFTESKIFFMCLFAIIVLAFISLIFTVDKKLSAVYLRRFLLEPSIFLITIYFYFASINVRAKIIFLYVFVAICMLQPLFTIIDFFDFMTERHMKFSDTDNTHSLGFYRAMPIFFSEAQTGYAFFLLIPLSISIGGLIATKYKALFAILVIINLIACTFAGTRFLYIATIVVCAMPFFIFSYKHKYKIISLVGIVIFAFFVSLYYISASFSDRYNLQKILDNVAKIWSMPPAAMGKFDSLCVSNRICMPQSLPKDSHIELEHSSLSRISMTKSAILAILDNPFRPNGFGLILFGKNIAQIFAKSPQNMPYPIQIQRDGSILPYYWTNHNGVLYIWFQLGVFGVIFMIWLHAWIFMQMRTLYKKHNLRPKNSFNILAQIFSISLTLLLVGLIVSNLFDALPNRAGQIMLFMIFGIALAIIPASAQKDLS